MVKPKHPPVLDGVKYRLQNVDYETYLERRDDYLVLRPLKRKSTEQQWNLVKVGGNQEIYELRDADNQGWVLNAELKGNTLTQGRSTVATGKQFIFYNAPVDDESDSQVYLVSVSLGNGNNTLAYAINSESAGIETDSNLRPKTVLSTVDKDEMYRWRLLEVNATCLPEGNEGKFRIRTFQGIVIHSVPNTNSLSIKNQNRGDHRAWTIQDLGNGRVILYNVLKKKYLDAKKDSQGLWAPTFADTAPDPSAGWIIRHTSDFTWSITIKRDTVRNGNTSPELLSLSLSGDIVELKPLKHAHNQIWLIEPTGAPLPTGPDNNTNGNDNTQPGGNTEVLPGSNILTDKDYQILNNNRTFGIQVKVNSAAGTYSVQLTTNGSGGVPSALTVEKGARGQAGEVGIYYDFNGKKYYLALNGTSVVGRQDSSFTWKLEQGAAQKFLIRDPSSQSAIYSSEVNNGNLAVKASPGGAGDPTVLWAFDLAP